MRERFSGRRRNPFDEAECGHHYGRALASWGLVLALAGFHYDGRDGASLSIPQVTRAAAGFGLRAAHGAPSSSPATTAAQPNVCTCWVGPCASSVYEPAGCSTPWRSRACLVPGSTSCNPRGSPLRDISRKGEHDHPWEGEC